MLSDHRSAGKPFGQVAINVAVSGLPGHQSPGGRRRRAASMESCFILSPLLDIEVLSPPRHGAGWAGSARLKQRSELFWLSAAPYRALSNFRSSASALTPTGSRSAALCVQPCNGHQLRALAVIPGRHVPPSQVARVGADAATPGSSQRGQRLASAPPEARCARGRRRRGRPGGAYMKRAIHVWRFIEPRGCE